MAAGALLVLLLAAAASPARTLAAPPTNVVATATAAAATGGITVTWDPPSGMGNLYRIQVKLGSTVVKTANEYSYLSDFSYTFTGLQTWTLYTVTVTTGWESAGVVTWTGSASTTVTTSGFNYDRDCTPTLSPSVSLGTLANTSGALLSSSGSLPSDLDDLPCADADRRASKYFTFVIAAGEAGAITIVANQGTSTMRPELLLRSGSDAYTGTVLFQDKRTTLANAQAAGLVAAGTYTLQLRSTVSVTGSPASARVGSYAVQLTRLSPSPGAINGLGSSILTSWDVGALVSNNSLNTIALTVKIDYKDTSDTGWTSKTTSVSPANGRRSLTVNITGITTGNTYQVRAAYTNSTTYVETDPFRVFGHVRLSPAPSGVQATSNMVNEATGQYEVRVEWETTDFTVDSDTTWGYWLRLNEGAPFANPSGYEHSQEHYFLYSEPGILSIEVRNQFLCTASTGNCDVTYHGIDYEVPALGEWLTVWSAPATVRVAGVNDVAAGEELARKNPDQAVVQVISVVMDAAGVDPAAGATRSLAVLLCLALAFAVAFAVVKRFGMNLAPVVLATLVWYAIFAGLGPEFFGVPPALAIVLIVVPLALGGFSLVRRFGQ